MIKDIYQKLKAVRYCVALGIVPHMEVVVRFSSELSEAPSNITDIDVLGIKPCSDSPSNRILFDCKTLNKMSAVNRALWAKGLIELTHCNEAFVILSKSAPEAHRLAGNSLGVRLFTDKLFDSFAVTVAKDYAIQNSYLETLAAWEKLAGIPSQYPALEDFYIYLTSSALLETQGTQGLRTLMSKCKKIEGELDPAKEIHRAIFKLILVQLCIYMSEMVRDFHNIFTPEMNKKEFEKLVRYYVWGGKDSYDLRQRLKAALQNAKGVTEIEPFEFPAWERFVELFRSFLDAPLLLGSACLPLKDLSFREISTPTPELDRRRINTFRCEQSSKAIYFGIGNLSY
jgi:hypothetical protein